MANIALHRIIVQIFVYKTGINVRHKYNPLEDYIRAIVEKYIDNN